VRRLCIHGPLYALARVSCPGASPFMATSDDTSSYKTLHKPLSSVWILFVIDSSRHLATSLSLR
jgi:hypothetical protein